LSHTPPIAGAIVRSLAATYLISTWPALALDPAQLVTQYSHTSWIQLGAIQSTPVNALAQTEDGYLWLGTEEAGLVRFDGQHFSRWEGSPGQVLPGAGIVSLRGEQSGGLWIGTSGGLAFEKNGELKVFTTHDGLNAGAVTAIHEDRDGAIWVGTYGYQSGGLSRIEHDRVQAFVRAPESPAGGVYDVLRNREGRLWTGGQGGLKLWTPKAPHPVEETSTVEIYSMAEDADGRLWLGSNRGLLSYSRGHIQAHSLLPGHLEIKVWRVLVDRDGALWVGTRGQGLFHLSRGRVERMTRADGLSGDTILALFEDRERNIWAGTANGIDRFREYNVATWSRREELPAGNVSSILGEPDGNLCAGIQTVGIFCFPGGHLHRLKSTSTSAMFQDHLGLVTVATTGGVFTLSPKGVRTLASDLDRVSSIAEDRDHNLWFGDFQRGLFRLHDGQLSSVAAERFASKPFSYLLGDRKGRLWIALNPGPLSVYQDGAFHSFSSADGLASDRLSSVFEDHSGTIWVATEHGLSRYADGKFVTLTMKNGLPCDSIQDILEDDIGSLWFRTSCGLIRAKLSDLMSASVSPPSPIEYKLFGASDGFQPTTRPLGTTPRATKTTDGRLWFIGGEGIAVLDPRSLRINNVKPPVHIERMTVDGKAVNLNSAPRLAPTLTRLQIDYTALSLTDPDRVFFQYKLDGYDRDWVDAGTRRQAFYGNLRPGFYRFHVKACNNDGLWNEAAGPLAFIVEPAFLQTRSFAWSCAIAGILFLISVSYLRLHRTPAALLRSFVKSYPIGGPGLGLLAARLVIGCILLTRFGMFNPLASNPVSGGSELPRLLEILSGLLLIAGFATPLVSGLLTSVLVLEMIQRAATDPIYASLSGPWENAVWGVVFFGTLTLTGPGAYSVDFKLFGHRRAYVTLRKSKV
jgi:ligand-binding sensor domain-containing protein/uncharacterized membrane protein YphA (DoxX/SURF4 family)